MPSLRSRPGTSAAGSKKPKTTQKNQTRGTLENSAPVDVDSVEPGNGTTPNQSAKLNEADVPDDPEVARGPELLVDTAAEAVEIINASSNKDKPDITDHEMVHTPVIEPNGRDIAHNHDSIDTGAEIPDSGMSTTTADTEDTTRSSQGAELIGSPPSGRDAAQSYDSIDRAETTAPAIKPESMTGQQRKRRMSDLDKNGDHGSGSKAAPIIIEEDSPRRPRKIRTPRFRDQIDRDNLWMLKTSRRIVKAQRLCDEEDQELDKEQERLDERKQRMKELRDLLEGTAEYINSCGAHEQKFSRQLEKEK